MLLSDIATELGNPAAARTFDINECTVSLRVKNQIALAALPPSKKNNRGRSAQYPELESLLVDYIAKRRDVGVAVCNAQLKTHAKYLAKKLKIRNFTASQMWCYKFMKINYLSNLRKTRISQRMPDDYEAKLLSSQQFVIKYRKLNGYLLGYIGNADQTPIYFDMPSSTTIDVKGMKTVTINTTGNEKNHFTCMLVYLADIKI